MLTMARRALPLLLCSIFSAIRSEARAPPGGPSCLALPCESAHPAGALPQKDLECLTLRGSSFDIGFQHGVAKRGEIQELFEVWAAQMRDLASSSGPANPEVADVRMSRESSLTSEQDSSSSSSSTPSSCAATPESEKSTPFYNSENFSLDRFCRLFLEDTKFEAAIREYTPDLLEEVRGLAAGVGLPFEQVLAFQLMDEQWAFGPDIGALLGRGGVLSGGPDIDVLNHLQSQLPSGGETLTRCEEPAAKRQRVVAQTQEGSLESSSRSRSPVEQKWPPGHCTSLAVMPGHCTSPATAQASIDGSESCPLIVAQNMDLEQFRHGYQLVLRIQPGATTTSSSAPVQHINKPALVQQLVFSHSGLLGLCGMNSAGVAVCVNNLAQLKHSRNEVIHSKLPVAFVIRGILAQDSVEKAKEFITKIGHASGQCYTVGGSCRGEYAVFQAEACGVGVSFRRGDAMKDGEESKMSQAPDRSFLAHANHPLFSDVAWFSSEAQRLK